MEAPGRPGTCFCTRIAPPGSRWQAKSRVHKKPCKRKAVHTEKAWLQKRRKTVNETAACGKSDTSTTASEAQKVSKTLWTQKQTKETQLQKKRTHANRV